MRSAGPLDPWYRHYVDHVALRRGPGAPIAPALRRDRHARLDFEREAIWYLRRVHARRPAADRVRIERLSRQIELPANLRSIGLIPTYAKEQQLGRALAAGGELPGHCFVVFVNAAASDCTRAEFASHVKRLRAETGTACGGTPVIVVAGHFRRRLPVRELRGLCTDALVLAARRARLADPIVVYGDADQLTAADGHLARVRRHFSEEPRLDFVAGPVLFGGDPDGRSLLPDGERLPELFLGNRFMQASQAARRAGDGVPPHFITQGANTAFRLAALCAGGGLDYRLWEDAQIGWWTTAMRLAPGDPVAYQAPHHCFDERLWVVTDPRRALRAILSRCAADEAWTFERYDAAPITADFAAQRSCYHRRRSLLQLDEVRRAAAGETVARDKVRRRVLYNFFRPLHPTNARWIAAVARRYGLSLVGARPVRWSRSRVIDDLYDWAD